jgi:hypothetical protein
VPGGHFQLFKIFFFALEFHFDWISPVSGVCRGSFWLFKIMSNIKDNNQTIYSSYYIPCSGSEHAVFFRSWEEKSQTLRFSLVHSSRDDPIRSNHSSTTLTLSPQSRPLSLTTTQPTTCCKQRKQGLETYKVLLDLFDSIGIVLKVMFVIFAFLYISLSLVLCFPWLDPRSMCPWPYFLISVGCTYSRCCLIELRKLD